MHHVATTLASERLAVYLEHHAFANRFRNHLAGLVYCSAPMLHRFARADELALAAWLIPRAPMATGFAEFDHGSRFAFS